MDLPAAILYLVFHVIAAATPTVFFYSFIQPIISQWSDDSYNRMYKAAWRSAWISNIVFYAAPAVVGGFTWLWNVYVVGGYIAWNQYLVVWGGTIMQIINFILMLAGAATYSEASSVGGSDTQVAAWIEFAVWTVLTGGIYAGYWLLNDNFLAYYVIEEIIHGIDPLGNSDPSVLDLF